MLSVADLGVFAGVGVMLVTSVVLSIGFFVLMLASMNNVFYFGMLTGITILLALLADFLLAPALMSIIIKNPGTEDPALNSLLEEA